jgi:hypothetical protein
MVALLLHSTTTAFHVPYVMNRIPTRGNYINREVTGTASTTISFIDGQRTHPISCGRRERALSMVKTRVGLEQRQESATPTGANNSKSCYFMKPYVDLPSLQSVDGEANMAICF